MLGESQVKCSEQYIFKNKKTSNMPLQTIVRSMQEPHMYYTAGYISATNGHEL
jgi:hypothetical protein